MEEIIVNLLENQRRKYIKQGKNVLNEEDIDNMLEVVINQFKVIEADREFIPQYITSLRKEMEQWIRRNAFVKCKVGIIMAEETEYNKINCISKEKEKFLVFNALKASLSKWPSSVVENMDIDTDNIMNQLPIHDEKEETEVIGLVMGAIQSGKTGNYCALIDKALACGYNLVFIFTGTLKNLRNLIQKRVERDCYGRDTITKERIGIGKYLDQIHVKMATTQDYEINNKNGRRSISGDVGEDTIKCVEYEEGRSLIFVCTRSIATIQKLTRWVEKQSFYNKESKKVERVSTLIIGDECDHGVINTAACNKQPTPINRAMRGLFDMFKKKVYIGYSATPFANIFIEPKPIDKIKYGTDFFPKDFIYLLETPNNYIGPNEFFGPNRYSYIKEIEDSGSLYDKNKATVNMPLSLKQAIINFIIVGAIRELRKMGDYSNSMLINIEPTIEPQNKISEMVKEYIGKMRDDVESGNTEYFIMNVKSILEQVKSRSQKIREQDNERGLIYSCDDFSDEEIVNKCKEYLCKKEFGEFKLKIMEINSTTSDDLNYDRYGEGGLHVIAIGGYKLSRGYTLEGLSVSYFLRKSPQADTQLQTCRWFGYADDYRNLIVLYTTSEISKILRGCTDISNQFMGLITKMSLKSKKPWEFGLYVENLGSKVRATARNKMRNSKKVLINNSEQAMYKVDIDISNFFLDDIVNQLNLDRVKEFVNSMDWEEKNGYFLVSHIGISEIVNFINAITICPTSRARSNQEIIYAIKACAREEKLEYFDVVIVTNKEVENTSRVLLGKEIEVCTMKRSGVMEKNNVYYETTGGRALTVRHLKYGLSEVEIKNIEDMTGKKFTETSVPNIQAIADERQKRKAGIMLIYLYDIGAINRGLEKWNKRIGVNPVGIHIALPGNRKNTRKTVFANKVYMDELLRIMHEEDELSE